MAFKNLLLGLGGIGIIGGASVGIYYGIKGEEKNAEDSKAVVDSEDEGEKAQDQKVEGTNKDQGSSDGDNSAVPSETDNQQQPQQPKQQ